VTIQSLPTGTVTFLFTDIEGSTRLLKQLGDEYATALQDHNELCRAAFDEHGGREVDTQGDAFFVVFGRARQAVAAALAAQRALAGHVWPRGLPLRVRMGMHTGEPVVSGDRYVGLGVHRAARICAAAHGGQVLLSEATYAVLADDVLPDVGFQDLGEHSLKDLDRAERLYGLVVPDLPSEFPPLRGSSAVSPPPPPAPRTSGRVVLADDSVLLREGLARLLTDAGFEVAGTAADASELVGLVTELKPSVVVTDIRMPPTHTDEGLVAAEEIRRLHPDIGVLVLSQYVEPRYATRLLEEYPERVGYLLKDRVSDVAVLADAIHRLERGECVVDPSIVSRLMARRRRGGGVATLTDDERDLLALVAEGYSNEAIAERLARDPEVVEEDVAHVFAKLDLDSAPNDVRRVLAVLAYMRT
jgi:class 3 adenylate cyclase/DNA-binding NarL/FixJ family response regulator